MHERGRTPELVCKRTGVGCRKPVRWGLVDEGSVVQFVRGAGTLTQQRRLAGNAWLRATMGVFGEGGKELGCHHTLCERNVFCERVGFVVCEQKETMAEQG